MSFTYPAFLFSFAVLAIPVLIHLFNFRKFKVVYFSDIRFLKEIRQETQSRSRLKHLLVLLSRLLAFSFLVFAFAQPVINTATQPVVKGKKAVSIYIDNSFSMDVVNKNGNLLENAKKKAKELVLAFQPGDQFQLLSNEFEGKQQRWLNKDDILEQLDEIKTCTISRPLSEVVSRQQDLLLKSPAAGKFSFLLSDFQKSTSDISKMKADSSLQLYLVPLVATTRNNLFIDSVWFDSPVRQLGATEHLHVRIQNKSTQAVENNSLKLFINDQLKTPASFSVPAGEATETVINFVSSNPGIQNCRVELNDYPVSFDDRYYFSYEVSAARNVLSINGDAQADPFLHKLFSGDSLFVFQEIPEARVDYSQFQHQDLLLLDNLHSISSGLSQSLFDYCKRGGSLLIFPGKEADLKSYASFYTQLGLSPLQDFDTVDTKVSRINRNADVYKEVFDPKTFSENNLDLPVVFGHYPSKRISSVREEPLLTLQNDQPFVSQYKVGAGNVYCCYAPLDESCSNFAKHALFVPTLYRMALLSKISGPLAYNLGKENLLPVKIELNGETVFHVQPLAGGNELIPEMLQEDATTLVKIPASELAAGNYYLRLESENITGFSMNFDRTESDLNCFNSDELKSQLDQHNLININILNTEIKNAGAVLSELNSGKKLWKICLLLALLFLAIETALLRLMN